jgi:hypothetical protein
LVHLKRERLSPAVLAWRYDVKVSKKRLRNKMRKLIGRKRAISRRLKEIDDALADYESSVGSSRTASEVRGGQAVASPFVRSEKPQH